MSQQSTKCSREERKPSGRRLLSFADLKVLKGIPFSRQWIAALINQGKFPRPVKPGGGTARYSYSAWFEDEVDEYLNNLGAARNREASLVP
jgi:predicted DNA-binding transcriptional regulator AlpA